MFVDFRIFCDPDTGANAAGANAAGAGAAGAGAAGAGAAGASAAGAGAGEKLFTQSEINAMMASNKRELRLKNEELIAQLEQTKQLSVLSNQQKEELELQIQNLQKQYLTKEEQAKIELDRITKKNDSALKDTMAERDRWKHDYSEMVIENSLRKAAEDAEAFKAEQIVSMLKVNTQLVEDVGADGKPNGKLVPKVNFSTVDKDGIPVTLMLPPAEAVKIMKETPQSYGNLFKSHLTSGIGGQQGVNQKVSPEKLKDINEYAKWRKDNPEYKLPS